MRIQPISQIKINQPVNFKSNPKGGIYTNITNNDGTLEDTVKQYNILVIFLSSLLAGLSLLAIFGKKGSFKLAESNLVKFESLKNNSKIPTLENCKSINKELKEILEQQININKAGNDIISEIGETPNTANRFLLYGSPGVGKSYFAKIYAKSMDADYMEVLFSDFNSKWVGETESKMKEIFNSILKTAEKNPNKKYAVTFNEIDALVVPPDNLPQSRGTHWVSILRQRSIFLNYLEVLKEKAPNVTIIGTTNISPKNSGLDRAAMSRFQNLIEVPYPNKECLKEALKMNLEKLKNKDEFFNANNEQLTELANKMADRKFSFRNLENVVQEAKNMFVSEKIKGNKEGFKIEYLNKAVQLVKLSDGELEQSTKKV